MKNAEINVLKLNISTLLAHDAGIFLYVWAKPSVIVKRVEKKVWRSGRVADCNPVGRRFAPRMLHAFQTFQLRRTSSILVKNVGEVRYF